jgi:hypothetical protein
MDTCYRCSLTPKSAYHYEICEFIHKERNRLRKFCRFFEPGCPNCVLTVMDTENKFSASMQFCKACSDATNVIKKTKTMLYFYLEDVDGKKPKDNFITDCKDCILHINRDSLLTIDIIFCRKCSSRFCVIAKGKHALYFY